MAAWTCRSCARYINNEIPHLSRLMLSSLEELFKNSEVMIVGNKTSEFADALKAYANPEHTIIDLVGQRPRPSNVNYQGICW